MVEHQPSKLDTWVRFPSPAFAKIIFRLYAIVAQLVERHLAKVEIAGSSPVYRSIKSMFMRTLGVNQVIRHITSVLITFFLAGTLGLKCRP